MTTEQYILRRRALPPALAALIDEALIVAGVPEYPTGKVPVVVDTTGLILRLSLRPGPKPEASAPGDTVIVKKGWLRGSLTVPKFLVLVEEVFHTYQYHRDGVVTTLMNYAHAFFIGKGQWIHALVPIEIEAKKIVDKVRPWARKAANRQRIEAIQ